VVERESIFKPVLGDLARGEELCVPKTSSV
jgi:hypothetical protein